MRLVASLVLVTACLIISGKTFFPILPSFFYQTISLLFIGTAGIYFYLADVKKNRPEFFVPLYIATLFAKILAYGGYVLFMVWDDPVQAANNALLFMVTYFIFTALEVAFLYQKVTR